MKMDYLMFLRSIRSSTFKLYISATGKFLPWIFATEMLKETNSKIYQKSDDNGNFTVKRTQNRFSKMGLNQRHEQLKKDVKGISKVFKFSLFFNINSQPSKLFL